MKSVLGLTRPNTTNIASGAASKFFGIYDDRSRLVAAREEISRAVEPLVFMIDVAVSRIPQAYFSPADRGRWAKRLKGVTPGRQ
jgi:hypothetical protein